MIIALSAGRDAPQELRERVALDEDGQRSVLAGVGGTVEELVVLSTCHRTEMYAVTPDPAADSVHALAALLPGLRASDQHDVRYMLGTEAVEHLLRVACGLDSLVVGEPQVLGQVRRAFVLAQEAGAVGPRLATVFGRAIRLGKQVRAETALGRIGRSIGTLTADHLSHRFAGLDGRPGAIVGAGEAAVDAARSLHRAGASLSVVSRTPASAARLAEQVGGSAHPLDEMTDVFGRSDFAVVAVSGGILVRSDHIPRREGPAPFAVVDLSVPRSVDARGRPDVDVRSLEEIPGPGGEDVAAAVADAEAMVRRELGEMEIREDARAAGPVILDLRARAEALVRDEVRRALGGMELSPQQAERVAAMAMRIANKLLHGPTTALRDSDEETRAMIRRMFGLDV